MKIAFKECTDEELPVAEQKWQARGYVLVDKTDPKTLEPMQYMKTFSNKAKWMLARRDPD
jgi:hypothetical protein